MLLTRLSVSRIKSLKRKSAIPQGLAVCTAAYFKKQTAKHLKSWLLVPLLFLAACGASGETAVQPITITETNTTNTEVADEPATTADRFPAEKYADFEIVTLLPRDAIPAIDNPQFLNVVDADEFYDPEELIIGVEFNGDARAYSVPFLSNHEIVNDTVGGVKIAVTW